jgi:hypothetical protein
MTKQLLFDSSTLISLGLTSTLHILEPLKKSYGGKFVIPDSVKKEVVDNAIRGLRFKYEGYQIKKLIDTGVLEVIAEKPYNKEISNLSSLANTTFSANGHAIKIVHPGELALLVIAHQGNDDDAVVIDEKITRLLVESPESLPTRLGAKLHTHISIDNHKLALLKKKMTDITILRSADISLAAYLKKHLDQNPDAFNGLLWALKYAGCAISEQEINEYTKYIGGSK